MPKTMPFVPTHSVFEAFDNCPRKYCASYVTKEIEYRPSAPADLGKCVHKLAEWYTLFSTDGDCPVLEDILHTSLTENVYQAVLADVKPMFPPQYAELRAHWSNILSVLERLPWDTPGAKFFVEYKCAIHQDMKGCNYYTKGGVFRAIIDLLVVCGPVAILLDWKSSKEMKESLQLERSTAAVFATFPDVKVCHTAFVSSRGQPSIKDGIARESLPALVSDIKAKTVEINKAYATNTWPEKKSGLCKEWCNVVKCPSNGGGAKCL